MTYNPVFSPRFRLILSSSDVEQSQAVRGVGGKGLGVALELFSPAMTPFDLVQQEL